MASVNNLVFGVILTFLGYLSVNHSAPMEKSDVPTRIKESTLSRSKFNNLLYSIANVNKERLGALKKFTDLQKYNTAQGVLRLSDERDPIVVVIALNKNNNDSSAVYEIYDSDMKNTPGETPVNKVLLQIKDYYDVLEKDKTKEVTYRFGDDGDLEKLYGINNYFRKAREMKIDPRDGEEITPITNNIQSREISYPDKNDKEIAIKKGQTNPIKKTSKTTVKEDIYSNLKNLKVNGTEFSNKDILRLFSSCTKKVIKTCKKACKSARNSVCDSYRCSSGMKKSFKRHCKSACKAKFDN